MGIPAMEKVANQVAPKMGAVQCTGLCYCTAFHMSSIQLRWVSGYSWAVFSVFWGNEVWGDDVMTLRWGYDTMV